MATEVALRGSPQSEFLHPLDEGALLKHLIDTNGREASSRKRPALTVLASLLPLAEAEVS